MKKHLTRGLLVLLVLTCCPQVARADAEKAPPQEGYSLSRGVTRQVLNNGLVVLIKEQHDQDTVALQLVTRVGQAQEDATNAGITTIIGNILQHRISHPATNLDDAVEATGSLMGHEETPDFCNLSLLTTSEHFTKLLGLVTDAYARRDFTAAEVETEKDKLLKLLEGQGVGKLIHDIFLETFYRYHPYRQPQGGNTTSVKALTTDRMNQFYQKYYTPNRSILCVVGDVDSAELMAHITRAFGGLKSAEETVKEITWEPKGSEKELQLTSGSQMAYLFLGYPAPGVKSPDYAAMRVMHALMGEGISSRLWVDLREERGLAYEIGSTYPVLEGPAHFLAYIITTPRQLTQARKRMFSEMDRLRQEDVPPPELEYARWKIIGQELLAQETSTGKALQLATSEAQGVGYQFPDQFIQEVRQVTPADVRRVAQKYLENYTLILARPPDAY